MSAKKIIKTYNELTMKIKFDFLSSIANLQLVNVYTFTIICFIILNFAPYYCNCLNFEDSNDAKDLAISPKL